MNDLPVVVQLVLAVVALIGLFAVTAAPQILAGIAEAKRDDYERQLRLQSEIERKIAIAEAAMAARRRGEPFVPPADYNR